MVQLWCSREARPGWSLGSCPGSRTPEAGTRTSDLGEQGLLAGVVWPTCIREQLMNRMLGCPRDCLAGATACRSRVGRGPRRSVLPNEHIC